MPDLGPIKNKPRKQRAPNKPKIDTSYRLTVADPVYFNEFVDNAHKAVAQIDRLNKEISRLQSQIDQLKTQLSHQELYNVKLYRLYKELVDKKSVNNGT